MSAPAQWFVMQDDQQLGPYTGEQLVEYAGNGSITREMLVWAEGMENWVPAEQIPNLFPPVAAQAVATPAHQAAPASHQAVAPDYGASIGAFPPAGIKAANFGSWSLPFFLGVFLVIFPTILSATLGPRQPEGSNFELIMFALFGLGCLSFLISEIVVLVFLHRAWKCIHYGGRARTTPGKAIGFLFIPFFNLYWLFQGIAGLPADWNATMSSHQETTSAPRLSEGLFLSFCIIHLVFAPINLFLIVPLVSQLCKGINSFAFRPTHTPGTLSFR